jgi:uncharacterized protein GlcG (DUF336 family)
LPSIGEEEHVMKKMAWTIALAALAFALPAKAEENLVVYKAMTPEVALELAQGALAACRKEGFQVAVAVVDRFGLTQVMLRDRFAGAHTPRTAEGKAWTAVSFRTPTLELNKMTQAGQEMSGLRHLPRVVTIGGGLLVEAGGSIVGGVGVSGAPGGEADERCAKAGIKAVEAKLEF